MYGIALKPSGGEKPFPGISVVELDRLHQNSLKSSDIEHFIENCFALYAHLHGSASTHIENQTDVVTLSEFPVTET